MTESQRPLAETLLHTMLERIRRGDWKPGTVLPGERELGREFGTSRVPLREALSMMRSLGVLETQHGRKSVIRPLNTAVLEQIFPLMFCLEGAAGFAQIFDLRLAVESRTAYLAAERRSADDLAELAALAARFRAQHEADSPECVATDLAFHVRLAEATGNPLFPLLLRTFSGFVIYSQTEGCRQSAARRLRAVQAHESILEAIVDGDPARAQVEMEAHLRYSASRTLKDQQAAEEVDASAAAAAGSSSKQEAEQASRVKIGSQRVPARTSRSAEPKSNATQKVAKTSAKTTRRGRPGS